MKIVVLMGGSSPERDVSIESGRNVAESLKSAGHEVLTLDTVLPIEQIYKKIEIDCDITGKDEENLIKLLITDEVKSADFIFNALHGGSGENGVVQAILDALGYKYNGSGVEGCAITMDKIATKHILNNLGIPTPRSFYYNYKEYKNIPIDKIINGFSLPLVIKPANQGSTVGVSVVYNKEEFNRGIEKAFRYDTDIIIEEFIEGREMTVGIIGDRAMPVLEIIPKHGIYDYECKYTDGMSEYIVPAKVRENVARQMQEMSLMAFKALRCYGYGRFDIRLSKDNIPYFLEFNALPGMTSHSLVPKAAEAMGMSFIELLEEIIRLGLER
ncbi:MAG: D-alanine--D-alanine ligase [Candidatus Marinimicrobia bacterium]|nr:D-alanine--D-alanine ligase [Candidatus Neomarinimicrobiota bacterium]